MEIEKRSTYHDSIYHFPLISIARSCKALSANKNTNVNNVYPVARSKYSKEWRVLKLVFAIKMLKIGT